MTATHHDDASASQSLAITIEQLRQVIAAGKKPGPRLQQAFTLALARMIREAMGAGIPVASPQPDEMTRPAVSGDPVFQAMVLKYRSAPVSKYVRLTETVKRDRRQVIKAVNDVAHPGRQQRMPPGWQRDAMVRLHHAIPVATVQPDAQPVAPSSWSHVADTVHSVLAMPQISTEPMLRHHLIELSDSPALQRLKQYEALASHTQVREYLALCDRQGPRSGSNTAALQGSESRQRGAQVEAKAAKAYRTLIDRMNTQIRTVGAAHDGFRVITSVHVPAIIAGRARHGKTEWDVVVLRQAGAEPDSWDVHLLVEVKASADAAVTDFPRLLRGLDLLALADPDKVYVFDAAEGRIRIRGASLAKLSTDDAVLKEKVRYWCDTPAILADHELTPANRQRLLSAPASLEFASRLMQDRNAEPSVLEAVWQELLSSSRLQPVLDHYPMVQTVRRLIDTH